MTTRIALFLCLLGAPPIGACGCLAPTSPPVGGGDAPPPTPTGDAGPDDDDPPAGPLVLPGYSADADCEDHGEVWDVSICDWLGSTDAVVIGVVQAVRLVEEPARWDRAGGGYDLVTAEECPGPINDALEIEIAVSAVLHGAPPAALAVRFGTIQKAAFLPRIQGEGEDVSWWSMAGEERGILPGDEIGFALHYVTTFGDQAYWSALAEPLFMFDSNGVTVSQRVTPDCHPQPPPNLDGMTRDALREQAAACGAMSAQGVARRERMWSGWAQSPEFCVAGVCVAPVQGVPTECDDDGDCPGGFCAIDGRCVDN